MPAGSPGVTASVSSVLILCGAELDIGLVAQSALPLLKGFFTLSLRNGFTRFSRFYFGRAIVLPTFQHLENVPAEFAMEGLA